MVTEHFGSGRDVRDLPDSSALREEHERYRQIVEDVNDVIYTLDTGGRITSLNPAFERFTGLDASEWIGRSIGDLLAPGSRKRAFENLAATLTKPGGAVRQYQMHNAAGELIDIEVSTKAQVAGGKVIGTIGIARDVTERNRLQRTLEDSRRIGTLGQLAASVAHEFNNVLMSIQPFAEILMRKAEGSEAAAIASKHIREAIARGKAVTAEILHYTNPKDPNLAPLDVAGWIGSLLISLRATLPPSLRIEAMPNETSILCDRYQLEQVIMNLATNARDAMPHGGTITIEASAAGDEWRERARLDRGVDYARITVRDTGTGMDAKTMSQLWDPLFTTKRGGTGLGLPIAKRLIERQGGAILVDSILGEGSAFHLILPVGTDGVESARTSWPVGATELRRVLLVEDEMSVASGLMMLFEMEGIDSRHVATGEEAVPALQSFAPQVVVLDMNLPGMTGLDVLSQIREHAPSQPVIVSSGQIGEMDFGPVTRAIRKPYAFEELLDLCREILQER